MPHPPALFAPSCEFYSNSILPVLLLSPVDCSLCNTIKFFPLQKKKQYLIIFAPNLFKQELYLSTNQEHNHNNLFICIDRTDELESKLKHFFYEIANEIPLLRKTTLLAVFCKHVYN